MTIEWLIFWLIAIVFFFPIVVGLIIAIFIISKIPWEKIFDNF